MQILIAGEVNPDLILRNYRTFPELGKEVLVEDFELNLGSSSAICAAGLARLGDSVTLAANVGADVYGDFCIAALARAGVDVSRINRRPDLKTGITVSITSAQDRALVTYLGAISSLRAEDVPETSLAGYRHLHVSSYFLQDGLRSGLRGLFAAARKAGLTTSLDTGYDPSEVWSRQLIETLEEVDVFLPNETEIQKISGCTDLLDGLRALDNGHTLVAGKLGADGCISRHRGEVLQVKAFPVDVVDTTGAGDSFNAGFLHAWLRGCPLRSCLLLGAACGALSTRGLGGTTTQPTLEEAESYIRANSGN